VVSPDDLVRDYGCDALRLYELFVGPPELDSEWDERGIDGVYRFLCRLYNLALTSYEANVEATPEMIKVRNKLARDITKRLENFSLNTVISGFMEYNNTLIGMAKDSGGIDRETMEVFIRLLAPFAPHISEEMWQAFGHDTSVFDAGCGWPSYDEELAKDNEIEIAVQVKGKMRGTIKISADTTKEEAIAKAKEALGDRLQGEIIKEIYVPGKIVNIVVK